MNLDNYIFIKERRNKLYVRGITQDKQHIDGIYEFTPTYYILTKNEPDGYSIYDEPLKAKQFSSIKEANSWKRDIKASNIRVYGDVSTEVQFIKELPKKNKVSVNDIILLYYDIETTMSQGGIDVFNTPEEIIAITAFDTKTNKIHVFASKPYEVSESAYEGYDVTHHVHSSEAEMLAAFVQYWKDVSPHVISGWNIENFDNPYIYSRIKKVLGETIANKLSPWEIVNISKKEFNGRPELHVEFFGITTFDYLPLYKKNTFTPTENYRLDTVVKKELKESKLDFSFANGFVDFYTNHWDKFIEYNIIDTILVHKLEEKLGIIGLMMEVSYTCGCPYHFANGTTQKLDTIIYNYANKINKVIPPYPKGAVKAHYEGAYVVEPIPGYYEGVCSFDLTSLYPSLIRQFNISPETLVKDYSKVPNEIVQLATKYNPDDIANLKVDTSVLKGTKYAIAANGSIYRQDKEGILKTVITNLFFDRKKYKKISFEYWEKANKETNEAKKKEYKNLSEYFDKKQMVMKLLLNSIYGAMGTPYFRYYELDNAMAITLSGQAVIKYIQREVNEWLNEKFMPEKKKGTKTNYLAYGDTDSSYFYLPDIINLAKENGFTYEQTYQLLKNFADGPMQEFITEAYKKFSEDYLNCPENLMYMDREVLSVRGGVFVAKKKYFLAVDDLEGKRYKEDDPYWKITGMEAIKAGQYPEHIRNELKEIIKLICMTRDEKVVQDYIKGLKERFWNWSPEDIAFNSAVNNIQKYIGPSGPRKGTPITVRAAYTYNQYIKNKRIIAEEITDGEKIKFLYLRVPNDAMSNVIGFKDFSVIKDLKDKIDINLQWEKNMLRPIKTMLDALGWSTEKKNTLF